MRKVYTLFLIAFATIWAYNVTAQKASHSFTWGINGHPLTQVAYTNNLEDQISQINDLGLKSYRFDVLLDSDGYAKKDALLTQVFKKLQANKIGALPVVMQSGLKGLDNGAIYKLSYRQGANFATRYGNYLSVVEVNNEADNKMMLPGNPSGTKSGDYDGEKSLKIITTIKGFIDGLKSINPSVKVTLSVSYIHYHYLQLLKDNNVNYDIIGCHWYSNMGPIYNAKPSGDNAIRQIQNRFNKPIWITEFNYSKGTVKATFAKQNSYITQSIPEMVSRGVTGLFVYELYDQPALRTRNINEAFYGLVFKDNAGNYIKKDAYNGFRQLIQRSGR